MMSGKGNYVMTDMTKDRKVRCKHVIQVGGAISGFINLILLSYRMEGGVTSVIRGWISSLQHPRHDHSLSNNDRRDDCSLHYSHYVIQIFTGRRYG